MDEDTYTRYAPVGPIAVLQHLKDPTGIEGYLHKLDILGDYLMLIAPDVERHPFEYARLTAFHRGITILDNGVIETGVPMDIDQLIELALICRATHLVLPDTLQNSEATLEQAKVALTRIGRVNRSHDTNIIPVLVPQGTTYVEIEACIRSLYNMAKHHPHIWGIPRWITNALGSRLPVLNMVASVPQEYLVCRSSGVHLLGMSRDLRDDIACSHYPNVIGIDSANPLILGQMGFELSDHSYSHPQRGNYWETKQLNKQAFDNVELVRRAIA